MDETPGQLTGETRIPVLARPGRLAGFDRQYGRNGTASLFRAHTPPPARGHVKVTGRRTK